MVWCARRGFVLAGGGAVPAPVDLRGRVGALAIHDDYAAEHKAEGEGDDGSATGRDAALGEHDYDVGEDDVDGVR